MQVQVPAKVLQGLLAVLDRVYMGHFGGMPVDILTDDELDAADTAYRWLVASRPRKEIPHAE